MFFTLVTENKAFKSCLLASLVVLGLILACRLLWEKFLDEASPRFFDFQRGIEHQYLHVMLQNVIPTILNGLSLIQSLPSTKDLHTVSAWPFVSQGENLSRGT